MNRIPKSDIVVNGKNLSRVILGTHIFGSSLPKEQSFALMDMYFDAGGNVLDTAAAYGDGKSESCIGEWLRERGCREDIVLCSKCGNPELDGGNFIRHRMSEGELRGDLERSFENLGVDHIDIYFLHKDDPSLPVEYFIDFFQPYLSSGAIRHIGASNWTYDRIKAANTYAKSRGLRGFEVSELAFCLKQHSQGWGEGERMIELSKADLHACIEDKMTVFGYNPQAYGYFYKNFDRTDAEMDGTQANKDTVRRLREICDARGLNVYQGLFGTYFGCGLKTFPIVSTSKAEHLLDVINNCDVTLDTADARYIFGERYF